MKDKFGFQFWLMWIISFAGFFVLAALLWTGVMTALFGAVRGKELTVTWLVAVMGSWFLLLTPFMRKKEQIWKRLNRDQERAVNAFLSGMGLFIGLMVLSALFWSWRYRPELGNEAAAALHRGWLKAVLGTWLIAALPFLVFMYRKADSVYRLAVERQSGPAETFKSTFLEQSQRKLSKNISDRLKTIPPTMTDGHVVTMVLKNRERVPHVFVFKAEEILGIYDREELGFSAQDVVDIESIPVEKLPAYDETRWLRLDGRR